MALARVLSRRAEEWRKLAAEQAPARVEDEREGMWSIVRREGEPKKIKIFFGSYLSVVLEEAGFEVKSETLGPQHIPGVWEPAVWVEVDTEEKAAAACAIIEAEEIERRQSDQLMRLEDAERAGLI